MAAKAPRCARSRSLSIKRSDETVDIAPTLAELIELDIPSHEIDGRALPLVLQ